MTTSRENFLHELDGAIDAVDYKQEEKPEDEIHLRGKF